MNETVTSGLENPAGLIGELIEASMEKDPRSVFEQRTILGRASEEIQRLRAGRPFDPFFDGDRSAFGKVEQVYRLIAGCPNHHIRAAQLLDMLKPSPASPLARALRKRKADETWRDETGNRDEL